MAANYLRKITTESLERILTSHKMWLKGEGGACADLMYTDFSGMDLRRMNFSKCRLEGSNFTRTILRSTKFDGADLNHCNFNKANLKGASFVNVNLRHSNIIQSMCYNVDFTGADFTYAHITRSYFTGSKGIISPIDFMNNNFERTEEGYIAYRRFEFPYREGDWSVGYGSILTEPVDYDRGVTYGCGVTVGTLDYINNLEKDGGKYVIWKLLIRYEWASGICVPYGSEGQIRCEKAELVEPIDN